MFSMVDLEDEKTVIKWLVVLFVAVILLCVICTWLTIEHNKKQIKNAGRFGERLVTNAIRDYLNQDDVLLTNVSIYADGKRAELDNVVVNSNGVFIIEVKNYKGDLWGREDDYEWIKEKESSGGNAYTKRVKNPIRQVKRQIYIMSRLLKEHGIKVWVEGYVFLLRLNSPVQSSCVLEVPSDIDRVIHRRTGQQLTTVEIQEIMKVLTRI